jgi:putative membrane protein
MRQHPDRPGETRSWASVTLAATTSAVCVLIGGAVILASHDLGPASTHMAIHIGLMNVVAPIAAAFMVLRTVPRPGHAGAAWAAAIVQLALLWIWHAPAFQEVLWRRPHFAMLVSHIPLFLGAFWFWWSILRLAGAARWHGIGVLLVTGKLACLLGVLLTFAPRLLNEAHSIQGVTLGDQQLAGLLMITACPLSYLVAGVVLVAQLLRGMEGALKPPNATGVR